MSTLVTPIKTYNIEVNKRTLLTPIINMVSVGESFKLEGDKLKFMLAASDLTAGKNAVRRVVVVSFAEGEVAPAKYQKVEETHYLVETLEPVKAPAPVAPTKGGRNNNGPRKGGNSGAPKSSPWGMSPEEIAAKKKASAEAAKRS